MYSFSNSFSRDIHKTRRRAKEFPAPQMLLQIQYTRFLPDVYKRQVMGIVVLAYVIRSLLYYVITYWGHTFGIRVEADIREALFGHMQTLGFDFYDRNRTGHLMSRLTLSLIHI